MSQGPFAWGVRVSSCTARPPAATHPRAPAPANAPWEGGGEGGCHLGLGAVGTGHCTGLPASDFPGDGGTPTQNTSHPHGGASAQAPNLQPPHHLLSELPRGPLGECPALPSPSVPSGPPLLDSTLPPAPRLRPWVRRSSDSVTGPDTAHESTANPRPLFLPGEMSSWPGDSHVPVFLQGLGLCLLCAGAGVHWPPSGLHVLLFLAG